MDACLVCILGDEGVGRESFACQFACNSLFETYDPTWDNTFPRIMTVDGRECFVRIEPRYYDPGEPIDIFILMYSVSSRASFENLKKHRDKLKILRPDAIVILVGNQCDVSGDRRQVSTEEGERAAHGFECNFAETSARTGSGVHGVVEGLVHAMRERKERKKEVKAKSKRRSKCQIQ